MGFPLRKPALPRFLSFDFQVYFGTSHARIYLSASLLGVNCATGMSALMRKEVLDATGGLKTFGKYLAEDYFMAQAFLVGYNFCVETSHEFFLIQFSLIQFRRKGFLSSSALSQLGRMREIAALLYSRIESPGKKLSLNVFALWKG